MSSRPHAPHASLSPDRSSAVGERVRQARHAAQLTQEGLAQAADLGTTHLQRIERGVANPTLATLYALGDALRVHPRDFLP
ncbi:helix-turn-helix domain-containing protein [Modestobacter sp. SSW1-42]|uniref:helix-turn-helix domain-containing protein n=1 Tax=Modestobacter sp. SSW1-42 TaxID=596372 RepID=UPI003986FC60